MNCKPQNRKISTLLKNQQLQNQLNALQSKYDELLELFKKAQAHLYSPKAKRVKKNPFNEAEVSADLSKPEPDGTVDEDSEVKQQDKQSKQTGKAGDKAITSDLSRVVTNYHLPDETCPCCQNSLHSMKTIVTEQIDIVPKHISVKRFIQHVYTCRTCHQNGTTTIINAPMPVAPIKGSIASPSTLAVVLTAKYVDLFIKAVKYTLNQWSYLIGYTENGDWPIDNNLVERDIRPVAIGRKKQAIFRLG